VTSRLATADQGDRRPTLGDMQPSITSDIPASPARPSPRWNRRIRIIAAVLLVAAVMWSGYVAKFGLCEARSKFCVLHVAGTRSDIGCEWDSWSCYVTTDGVDPSTHVFLHLGR
jgi:hypothetical protein